MVRENFVNFGTSALSGAITNVASTLSVTGGSGSSFPSTNFVICIDTELIYISSRSGDTFTVASSGRGYDSSTAAAHNAGVTVQLSVTAYNVNHIWSALADTFNPMVPPTQTPLSATGVPTGSASAYDNEMEVAGSWTLYPTPGSVPVDALLNIGVTVPSNFILKRGGTDSQLYGAYVTFGQTSSTVFTVTCKVSSCLNMITQGGQESDFHFYVSDQSNPSGGASVGNMFKVLVADTAASTSSTQNTNARTVRVVKVTSGTGTQQGNTYIFPYALPLYLRINYDGAGRWQTFFGDGITYSLVSDVGSFSITPQTIGFHCSVSNSTSSQIVLVDFVRAVLGTRLQYFL